MTFSLLSRMRFQPVMSMTTVAASWEQTTAALVAQPNFTMQTKAMIMTTRMGSRATGREGRSSRSRPASGMKEGAT